MSDQRTITVHDVGNKWEAEDRAVEVFASDLDAVLMLEGLPTFLARTGEDVGRAMLKLGWCKGESA